MKNNTCYLCNSTDLKARKGSVRDNKELKILECSSCGLVFLSSFEHIKKGFYENSGMFRNNNGGGVNVTGYLKQTNADDKRRFRQFSEFIVNKNILDFGCGNAGFLMRAKELASACYGVEPNKLFQEHYSKINIQVFPNLNSINEKFDAIFMFHVLEHIEDPVNLLQKLKSLLNVNGRLIVEVPSSDDALLTLYNNNGFSHFTYWSPHLFLYNQRTLADLMRKSGFEIEYIQQFQRYGLSNHLHWLSNDKPGGHAKWHFLDSQELNSAYAASLAKIGKCDTLIGSFL
jgi:SAM-dependent methyltransferase